MDVAELIKAITHTMTCSKCPCTCKAREKSSQANCDRHWFEMLTDVKTIVTLETAQWEEVRNNLT